MRKIRISRKRNPGCWGMAYPDKWRIELDPKLDEKTEIDIAAHETIHVVAPFLEENTVNQLGIHIADVLWRLGYRKHEGD